MSSKALKANCLQNIFWWHILFRLEMVLKARHDHYPIASNKD